MRKDTWVGLFIGSILLAVSLEFYSILDSDPNTWSLTSLIVTYIPTWIGLPLILGFAVWLAHHFLVYYGKQNKSRKNN